MFFKYRDYDDYKMNSNYALANSLYECPFCHEYYRGYQSLLTYLSNEKYSMKFKKEPQQLNYIWRSYNVCPHCLKRMNPKTVKETYKWMDNHPYSPKISHWGLMKIEKTIKRVKKNNYDLRSIDAFRKKLNR